MGLIEDLFGDDNILTTPVDRFILDNNVSALHRYNMTVLTFTEELRIPPYSQYSSH